MHVALYRKRNKDAYDNDADHLVRLDGNGSLRNVNILMDGRTDLDLATGLEEAYSARISATRWYPEYAPTTKHSWKEVEEYIHALPEIEQAVFDAYYLQHQSQKKIAAAHNMTQASVSYRLAAIQQRILYLKDRPQAPLWMRDYLIDVLDARRADMLMKYIHTTSQTKTAQWIMRHYKDQKRCTQLTVRNVCRSTIEKLVKGGTPEGLKIAEILRYIRPYALSRLITPRNRHVV